MFEEYTNIPKYT